MLSEGDVVWQDLKRCRRALQKRYELEQANGRRGSMKIIAATTPRIAARNGTTQGCIVFRSAAVYPNHPSYRPRWRQPK